MPRRSDPQVAIFAGEPSGDRQGGALCRAMRRERSAIHFWGIGGAGLRDAGVTIAYDSSGWGAMGVAEALKLAPRLLWVLSRIKKRLAAERPDLVILIDFGAFNVKVARAAKALGLRVFYYFPPGSWKRGRAVDPEFARSVDRFVTPFPWSAESLRAAGCDAHFVGHPLVDLVGGPRNRAAVCSEAGLDPARPIICYLPGSRRHEIRYNWPAMAGAARTLAEENAELQQVVLAAAGPAGEALRRATGRGGPVRLVPYTADLIAVADLVITKAGSVTLEAALHQRPMIVLYRGSWLQELEYHLWHQRRIQYIAMPSILADRLISPELIQRMATPERIAAEARKLLTASGDREEQIRSLAEVTALLGPPGAVERAARLALEMLPSTPSAPESLGSSSDDARPSSASRPCS